MLEIFTHPFMQRALVGGLLVGGVAGAFGPLIVQRRMAFLGTGLSHAAFGGVALGLLLGVSPLAVALPFTIVVALATVWLQERTTLATDTSIGILFALAMALGVIFLALRESYSADAFTYLFGSILAIQTSDLYATLAVAAGTLMLLPMWGRWAYATFDRPLARADRLAVQRDDYLLAAVLATAIVASIKVVGIILMSSFLILPAATARQLATTFTAMSLLSVALGPLSVLAGLIASYHADLPSGPTIILVQVMLFVVALAVGRQR